MSNFLCIFLILIMLLFLISLFRIDHFKSINSLPIKFNSKKIINPDKYMSKPLSKSEKLQQDISAELSSQPLTFQNQLYTFDKYPHVGEKQLCKTNSDCSQITAKCKGIDAATGIGVCVLDNNEQTLFDITY